jgi:hypothetical protein
MSITNLVLCPLLIAWLPTLGRELEPIERERRRHDAADQRPVAERPRRLPCASWDDDLRLVARSDGVSQPMTHDGRGASASVRRPGAGRGSRCWPAARRVPMVTATSPRTNHPRDGDAAGGPRSRRPLWSSSGAHEPPNGFDDQVRTVDLHVVAGTPRRRPSNSPRRQRIVGGPPCRRDLGVSGL